MTIEIPDTGMTEEQEIDALLAELESLVPDATPESEAELDRLTAELAEKLKGSEP
jgi:hypothetical protein